MAQKYMVGLNCSHIRMHCKQLCIIFLVCTFVLFLGLMNELAEKGLLAEVQSNLPPDARLEPALCIHAAPYTDSLLQALGMLEQ